MVDIPLDLVQFNIMDILRNVNNMTSVVISVV